MRRAGLDPLDPYRFDRFFQELYFLQSSLDEKKIQDLPEDWRFKGVAEAFEMIDSDGGEAMSYRDGDALARLDELRCYGPNRDGLRSVAAVRGEPLQAATDCPGERRRD